MNVLGLLIKSLRRDFLTVSPLEFYRLCISVEETPWLQEYSEVTEFLTKLGTRVPLNKLPVQYSTTVLSFLERLSPQKQSITRASTSIESLRSAIRVQSFTRSHRESEVAQFYKAIELHGTELNVSELVHSVVLLAKERCTNDEAIRSLSKRLQFFLKDLKTNELVQLLKSYTMLKFTSSRIVGELVHIISERREELTVSETRDVACALALVDTKLFNLKLYQYCMNHILPKNTSLITIRNLLDLHFLRGHALSESLRKLVWKNFLQCLQVSSQPTESTLKVFVSFVRLGFVSADTYKQIEDKMCMSVARCDYKLASNTLIACSDLDGPLHSLIVCLLTRISETIQSADVNSFCDVLAFCCEIQGVNNHKIKDAFLRRVTQVSNYLTPLQAGHVLICFLRMNLSDRNSLEILANIVVSQSPKEFVLASAILRVMLETGNKDISMVKYFHSAVESLISTLTMDDLVLAFRGLRLLNIDSQHTQDKLSNRARYLAKDPRIASQLPSEFQSILSH